MLQKSQPEKSIPGSQPESQLANQPSFPPVPIPTPPPYTLPPELSATQKYPPYSQRPSYSYLYLKPDDESRRRSGIVVLTRGQKVRGYVSRHRYWLALIGVLAVGAMVVGIVLVAHTFYVGFGGQGFLRTRAVDCSNGLVGEGEDEWWVGGDLTTGPMGRGYRADERTHKLRIRLSAA